MAHNDFSTAKSIEPKSNYVNTPTIFIPSADADNIGAKVIGTFLLAKEVPKKDDPTKNNYFVEMRFEKSENIGSVTMKQGAKYIPAEVKEGDIVTLFAPSRLYRALIQLNPGDRFQAIYRGMKKVQGQKGGAAHHFDVKSIACDLTPEDQAYIESRKQRTQVIPIAIAQEADDEAKAVFEQMEG